MKFCFRKYHQDVPFSEFLNKVEKDEPKWQCKICRQKLSLANQLRHQVICRPPNYDQSSSSSSDNDDHDDDTPVSVSSKGRQATDSSEERVAPRKYMRFVSSSESSESEEPIVEQPNMENNAPTTVSSETQTDDCNIIENDYAISVTNNIEAVSPISNKSCSKKSVTFADEVNKLDDLYEFESDAENNQYNEEDIPSGDANYSQAENSLVQYHFNKWWLGMDKSKYFGVDDCPLEIFLPNDEPDFIKLVVENYKEHEKRRDQCDMVMQEVENSEAKNKQFNKKRDQPFVDEYFEYVSNFTTKEVLQFFSVEDNQEGQQGSKSSTAKQYCYRIVELFQFLSKKYPGFHFDWFIDYKNEIEKCVSDEGETTVEIFIPPKAIFSEFLKSYLYGSNPAANVGLRIFAVKKLLNFLIQKYKDNEHLFQGSLVEKKSLLECLTSKLKNIDEDICPAGAVKHISIASNRNHRRSLSEQLKKCPGKSIENIMKGVGEYLMSEAYTSQKENLYFLAYEKAKVPSPREYMACTSWLLEQLICIGGS